MSHTTSVELSPLGSTTEYKNTYDAALLYPIARYPEGQEKHFKGVDIWNAYEVSWLNAKGKPIVRLAEFRIAANSKNLVESKSFKLYLNSFNLTRFETEAEVVALMQKDLAKVVEGEVKVNFYQLDKAPVFGQFAGFCLDNLDVDIEDYTPNAALLTNGLVDDGKVDEVEEVLYSHLLKSNCPVTGQPDWATVGISYQGPEINREGLLKYLVSYREHGDFHEHCVEQIFADILAQCKPNSLSVYARYVRRGGLDINPFRSTEDIDPENMRLSRQ